MQQITEQQILAMAPNAAAASNGKKISQKGGFVRLERSGDDTFYLGECKGSGKSNYITSVDYINPQSPVFRCSCPSRQFPCKHSLALLYEMLAQKNFAVAEIPEDILKKREKKQARDAKAQQTDTDTGAGEEGEKAAKKKASAAKSGNAARKKKLKKQLEGLELTAQLVRNLMAAGLGTMGGTALNTYRDLAKQLGDYYLPGPQRLLNRLILEMEAFQKDGQDRHYEAAIDRLEKLWTLVKKSRSYLQEKLEQEEAAPDDSPLYEELGGIWKLSELEAAGHGKADCDLLQLAFWVTYDEARKEYIDTGCWADFASGEIYMTYNYRPIKALKYVRQEDSVFGVARVTAAACYPGEGNPRIRWENADIRPVEAGDLQIIRSMAATGLAQEAKQAKNFLKNAMSGPMLFRLIAYETIGRTEEGIALRTAGGETIRLGDSPELEPTTDRVSLLPEGGLLQGQVLLGAFFYEKESERLLLQPISIITEKDIVRLLY